MNARVKAALDKLAGKKIAAAHLNTRGELELHFADGTMATVMSDPEGNGPGSLHYAEESATARHGIAITPIGGR